MDTKNTNSLPEKTKLKDNKIFRWIIIPICLALCFFGRFIPLPNLSDSASGVIFIFLGSLILWLTIGIDWPSLLCIFALGLLNVPNALTFKTVFTASFGNETWVFLLFTFVCTYALSKTSLIKRIAIDFINFKLAKKSGYWFIFLFLVAVLILGLFISPTVLFVVILPILNEVFEIAKIDKGEKVAKVLMMGLGFTVSISSGMTPIAHVFPVLAMSSAKITISPLSYMLFAVPIGLICFLLMYAMLCLFVKPDVSKLQNADVSSLKNELPKVNTKDIITVVIFGIVILLWIIPSFFKDLSPDFYNFINKYGTAMPPLLGAIALCIVRVDGKPLVKVDDALKNGVPWSSLIMCAGTLALASALTNDTIGIKAFLQNNLGGAIATLPMIALVIIFATWAALQTNVSSNMVTATLVATVAASVIAAGSTGVNLNAVICIIGMLASFAFATPPSMPHIAIVAGSDYCSTKDVLIYGSILMVLSIIVAVVIGYPLGTLVL